MSAPMVVRPRKGACVICDLPLEQWQEINGVIWDGTRRNHGYVKAAQRALVALTGQERDRKVFIRHAAHTEKAWHKATTTDPVAPRERPVFSSDYAGITDAAAELGAKALASLSDDVDAMDAKDRISLAKLGVTARQQQERLRIEKDRPEIGVLAIIGLGSGHLAELPEAEASQVIDVDAMRRVVAEERAQLEERARGTG